MKTLCFSLIPIGIIILIFSIKLVRNTFSGNIILRLPYLQKSSEFSLTKQGNYSIWQEGQFFRKAPLDEFRPEITSKSTAMTIKLWPSLFRPNSNNGRTSRIELFRFKAPAGKYKLELTEGSSISTVEKNIIRGVPARMVDYDKYFILVRESQPRYIAMIGIGLIAMAGFCIIGGFVFGILADQIFTS
jgi:hypothetical protein